MLAVALFAQQAYGQGPSTEASASSASQRESTPPLGLRIEGESPVAREVLEQELTRAVGRPITAEERAEDGVITLSFEKDAATGALRVQVRYEPPPDQLVRVDVVTGDTAKIAPRVANLVQSLLRQDAGVTIVTPPPPPMPATTETAVPASGASNGCAATEGTSNKSAPEVEAPAPPKSQLTLQKPESWRIVAGVRASAFGSTAASGLDGQGRITGDVWQLGGSVQAIAPSFGRLRLGIEGVIDKLKAEGALGNGVNGSLQGFYAGLSAMPSFRVWTTSNGFEVNVSGHIGVTLMQSLELSGFTSSTVESQGDIGYRAGLAVDVNYWLGKQFGLNGAVGLDEVKADIATFRSADEGSGVVRNDVRMWVKQPYLRLGASYRF